MGTLGQYLRDAREARGIDLRDAAQQTRISINYLKALEAEDFSKLPGEVFVKGFLKNYGKFLRLDEAVIMLKYGETRPQQPAAAAAAERVPTAPPTEAKAPAGIPIEPFLWGGGIIAILALFLFTALPQRRHEPVQSVTSSLSSTATATSAPVTAQTTTPVGSDKLYLEVVALENTWVLVRTDSSPQKKAVLNKGESLIWSADERFLVSFGSVESLKILLNGQELTVNEPRKTVVRDLVITASGIMAKKVQAEKPKQPAQKREPAPQPKPQMQPQRPDAAEPPSTPKPAAPEPPAKPESVPGGQAKPPDTVYPAQ